MKILLLNPPSQNNTAFTREGRCTQKRGTWGTVWPPITLATSGAMLEEKGFHPVIIDCAAQDISSKEILKKIKKDAFALIAWSTGTPTIEEDLELAVAIRKICPGAKTAIFGTHATRLADSCLKKSSGPDFIIRNEPEESLVELAECLRDKKDVRRVAGISFIDNFRRITHNPQRPFIPDLTCLPFPAWHLLDLDRYRLPLIGERFLIVSPARGCPYSCSFCTSHTYYGKKLRKRSPEKVVAEIEHNIRQFGIKSFFMWADTFTTDRDYVMELCNCLNRMGVHIRWACNSRVDTVDDEMLVSMAKAGCFMISYGIETADSKTLSRAGKMVDPRSPRKAVEMAKNAGIQVAAHFMLGLPGETSESLRRTINLSISLNPDFAQFYCTTPFPGSKLYEEALKEGWIDKPVFNNFKQDNAVMNLPHLTPKKVNQHRKRALIRFYLRPGPLFRIAGMIRPEYVGNIFGKALRSISRAHVPFVR